MARPIRSNRPAVKAKGEDSLPSAVKKASPPEAGSAPEWTLYILECGDGTFYTGIAKDLSRRLLQHNEGRASRYTRCRRPVKIIYREPCGNRSEASIREAAVKSLSRPEKEKLIRKRKPGRSRPSTIKFK